MDRVGNLLVFGEIVLQRTGKCLSYLKKSDLIAVGDIESAVGTQMSTYARKKHVIAAEMRRSTFTVFAEICLRSREFEAST